MELFTAHDYDAVTIEDICARADVAKATFFLHFPNKAALLTEFNEQMAAQVARRLAAHSGSAEEKLALIVREFAAETERHATVLHKMIREFLNQPALPVAAEAANRSVIELVAATIAQGQTSGEFRRDARADLAATALVAAWGAIVHWWSINDVTTNARQVLSNVLDIALNGIKEPAAATPESTS